MQNKKIVTIGGGTGSFTLLSGLKKYPLDISAIVSMADDGGSTGVLRDELGVLPPGDVRQCLVALSDSSEILRDLMNYRFESGGLSGHNFGNLFLSALEKINGSFAEGVEEASKILDVRGEVIPVSEENMRLFIRLKDNSVLNGESHLDHNQEVRDIGIKNIFLRPKVSGSKKAIEKIKKADFIIIGPGDLFGSILPNLLVPEISEAIKKSEAKIIFNCNLTNKKGQTDNFSLEDYIKIVEQYVGRGRISFVTFNSRKIPEKLVVRYEKREGKDALIKIAGETRRKYRIVKADILSQAGIKEAVVDASADARSFIRHDSQKLAKVLVMIMEMEEYENLVDEII